VAYWGYFPFIEDFLENIENPQVIEVGVDKAQMFIPLLVWMKLNKQRFSLLGIDVVKRTELTLQLDLICRWTTPKQQVHFMVGSSLEALPALLEHEENKGAADLVLLDGDHNYYTVKRELECINELMSDHGIIIVDDYHGEGGTQDEFFSEFQGYEDINGPVSREAATDNNPENVGVKAAVDQFLIQNKEWALTSDIKPGYEPVVLYKPDHIGLSKIDPENQYRPKKRKGV
jgi:hypothetical protein|tara:strand:+ start:734 stop:1426 length:693 start_codon:yes stop_codon:yes gene_type:complete